LNDLAATVAAMAGAALPAGAAEDSRSIVPLLEGCQAAAPVRADLIHHSGTGVFSIRRDTWKLVHESEGSGGWPPPAGEPPVPGSPGQLYDLARDPAEQNNLFRQEKGIARELTELLLRQRESRPANDGRSTPRPGG
jgi:arylsulfatase A-like enzyme